MDPRLDRAASLTRSIEKAVAAAQWSVVEMLVAELGKLTILTETKAAPETPDNVVRLPVRRAR